MVVIPNSTNGQRWFDYVSKRLNELERGDGDFTGLKRPPKEVIDNARAFANSFFTYYTPTPSVIPDEDGNIEFIWVKGGWHLEILVSPDEEVFVWMQHIRSGELKEGSMDKFWPFILQLWMKDYCGNF